ncbi:MAG: hypothetical protein EA417_08770 [Gammaproteobacteria bacterium]|nr:MAG: hypothetical protein EA417_08770 [Gammaproteobacteria bacterium]
MQKHKLAALITLATVTAPAWSSGGHYPIDDAELAEPGVLQIEAWDAGFAGSAWAFALLPAITLQGLPLKWTADHVRLENCGDRVRPFESGANWPLIGHESRVNTCT